MNLKHGFDRAPLPLRQQSFRRFYAPVVLTITSQVLRLKKMVGGAPFCSWRFLTKRKALPADKTLWIELVICTQRTTSAAPRPLPLSLNARWRVRLGSSLRPLHYTLPPSFLSCLIIRTRPACTEEGRNICAHEGQQEAEEGAGSTVYVLTEYEW